MSGSGLRQNCDQPHKSQIVETASIDRHTGPHVDLAVRPLRHGPKWFRGRSLSRSEFDWSTNYSETSFLEKLIKSHKENYSHKGELCDPEMSELRTWNTKKRSAMTCACIRDNESGLHMSCRSTEMEVTDYFRPDTEGDVVSTDGTQVPKMAINHCGTAPRHVSREIESSLTWTRHRPILQIFLIEKKVTRWIAWSWFCLSQGSIWLINRSN